MASVQTEATGGARPRVLVVAGAQTDLGTLPPLLDEHGCLVVRCAYLQEAVRQTGILLPHLVVVAEASLLDLLDLCRAIRGVSAAPLLVLGQRASEEDEVLCLEYGADSYLQAGSSPRRVRAHLSALLRRGLGELRPEAESGLTFGDVRIDVRRHRVYRGDRELELSQKEYALLTFLVENAGQAVSRQALADYVWGANATGESRSLDVHIHWLREKLEADAANPQHIRTIRGVGYCFEP